MISSKKKKENNKNNRRILQIGGMRLFSLFLQGRGWEAFPVDEERWKNSFGWDGRTIIGQKPGDELNRCRAEHLQAIVDARKRRRGAFSQDGVVAADDRHAFSECCQSFLRTDGEQVLGSNDGSEVEVCGQSLSDDVFGIFQCSGQDADQMIVCAASIFGDT